MANQVSTGSAYASVDKLDAFLSHFIAADLIFVLVAIQNYGIRSDTRSSCVSH